MASEWARKKAEEIVATPDPWEKAWSVYNRAVAAIAAALDEARQEGAERERWECNQSLKQYVTVSEKDEGPGFLRGLDGAIRAIATRGAMRGPEEGK